MMFANGTSGLFNIRPCHHPSAARAAHALPFDATSMIPAWVQRAVDSLPPNLVTRIRIFDPPNPNRRVNSSNLVVLVATGRIPFIDGLGPDGKGAHTDYEQIYYSSLQQRTQLMLRLFETLE